MRLGILVCIVCTEPYTHTCRVRFHYEVYNIRYGNILRLAPSSPCVKKEAPCRVRGENIKSPKSRIRSLRGTHICTYIHTYIERTLCMPPTSHTDGSSTPIASCKMNRGQPFHPIAGHIHSPSTYSHAISLLFNHLVADRNTVSNSILAANLIARVSHTINEKKKRYKKTVRMSKKPPQCN